MSRIQVLVAGGLLFTLLSSAAASSDQPNDGPAVLRDRILKADSSDAAGEAYKAYFLRLGLAALQERQKDEETGIALQAAWEVHKKPAKRPKEISGRSDDIYDPDELAKFVTFLKERTKAPIPGWWAETIVNVDLFPGQHHFFMGPSDTSEPKLRKAKTGSIVPEGAELEERGDSLVYASGGRTVAFPKDTFKDAFGNCYAGSLGEKHSVVAYYPLYGGFAFHLAGFEGLGGKPAWKADVWAAGRDEIGGHGFHDVELTVKDDTVFVFGAESHGIYMEAFDISTGKCKYRFCSCYWFNFAEEWGLK